MMEKYHVANINSIVVVENIPYKMDRMDQWCISGFLKAETRMLDGNKLY
ncbi:MAG: hypothetical protein IPN86_13985 [Saprospiraceae bacterium]|nr:hypothetical protein [Saprospiraceae bacterium]